MKQIRFQYTFILAFMWLLSPLSVAAEEWPIKEFNVVKNGPGASPSGIPISNATAREIEKWLNTVAEEYERMGFKQPHLTDVGTYSGVEKYDVYVYPFSVAPAAYSYDCEEGRNPRIHVNSVALDPSASGILTTKLYQDLAHELFHAVQHSYDLFKNNCDVGRWIKEGTAEAVGFEMARKLYPKRKPRNMCQAGMRRYDRELHTDDKNQKGDFPCEGIAGSLDYAASSFWQFLGEYSTRKGINMATEEFSPPDFRYLHNFFQTPHPMGTYAREYAWLDSVLQQNNRYGKHQFGISLHTAYSRFVGTFSSYWKPRRTIHYGNTVGGGTLNEKNWMQWIFGICEEVSVTKNASTALTAEIMPVASRCIKMNFDFTGRVNLTFYVTGENQSIDLESLAISTNGGEKIVRRHPAEQHADKIGKFLIEAKSGTPQYFIVSNVQRKNPESTNDIAPTFSIVSEFTSTSMAKAKKKKQDKPDPTAEEELGNAWESRSWKGHASQKTKSPCTRPFEYSSCGPITRIELHLVPDTSQLLDEIDEPTMSLERTMRVLDAIVQRGDEQVPGDIAKALQEIREQDGWMVRMEIPQIQPGFVGSISNAHIRVEKALNPDGSANGAWTAIGPGWVGPCDGPGLGYWPSSGEVSVVEFSKNSLRGAFTAKLAGEGPGCQALPIANSISGSFTTTDIRWGQPAPAISDDDIIDQTIEDTNELLPGLITDEMRDHIKDSARKERQKQDQLKQDEATDRKKTSVFQECGCTCEMEMSFCASNPEAECCVSCEPLFNACKTDQKTHNAVQGGEDAREDTEVLAMRQQYEAYIESLGVSGDMKEQMMDAFDQLKTANEKRLFIMSLPIK